MGDTSPRTYKVFKGNTAGQIIEMEIPVDAIQSPRDLGSLSSTSSNGSTHQ